MSDLIDRAELRARLTTIDRATGVQYPKFDPQFTEDWCAHHYGNTTYECSCLVPVEAVRALIDAAPSPTLTREDLVLKLRRKGWPEDVAHEILDTLAGDKAALPGACSCTGIEGVPPTSIADCPVHFRLAGDKAEAPTTVRDDPNRYTETADDRAAVDDR